MYQYNLIKIDSIYLTSDGTLNGRRAVTSVKGLNELYNGQAGTARSNADGSKILQLADLKGVEIEIEFTDWVYKSTLDTVKARLTTFISNGLPFALEITGEAGAFVLLTVIFDWNPLPIEFGTEYLTGRIKGAKIHLATA
ncbi:MAG: hypothetical protein ACR2MD_01065 [Aridibacter sp.]